jgi:hypothetical protein
MEKSNVHRLLRRKPEEKKPLGRPRHRWMDNIKMDLVEIGRCWWRLEWSGSK